MHAGINHLNKIITRLFVLLSLIISTAISAQSSTAFCNATTLTLPEMVRLLQTNNPQITQAYYNYLAARAQAPQIYAPNNPQVGAIHYPLLGAPPAYGYTLSESMPFFGKKRLAAAIATDQAQTVNSQNKALVVQLINQLRLNFFQLLLQQQQVIITKQTIARLELMKQISKARYANNAAAYVDYLNTQVAQSSAENDLFALTQQMIITRNTLNVLIGRCPNSPLQLKGSISIPCIPQESVECIEQQAMTTNPNLEGAAYQVSAAEKNLSLSRLAYFPDFNVAGTINSAQIPGPQFNHANSYGFEVDMTLPIWFYRKENFGVAQARANLISSQANDISLQQQTRLAVTSAYANLNQALKQSSFISTHQLPQAIQAFKLALTNYATYSTISTITFADLLTAQNNLQQTQLALAETNVLAQQSYANLEAAVGAKVK